MGKARRPPEQSDQELVAVALKLQRKQPFLSEGALCGELGVGREYLADRTKRTKSEALIELRSMLDALRRAAYEKHGWALMTGKKKGNVIAFIWQTRNVLKWRDDPSKLRRGAEPPRGAEPLNEQAALLVNRLKNLVKDPAK